jgi:hypothetical protein
MITFNPARNQTYAGYSFYRCVQHFSKTSTVSPNAHRVNFDMCHQFNRDGLFCGTCKENHYPLVYSYKLNCKLCSDREIRRSVFILFVVAFIPVSIFYGIVLLFKFNANSPSLHGFIFLAQILTQTSNMKIFYTKFDSSRHHEKDMWPDLGKPSVRDPRANRAIRVFSSSGRKLSKSSFCHIMHVKQPYCSRHLRRLVVAK